MKTNRRSTFEKFVIGSLVLLAAGAFAKYSKSQSKRDRGTDQDQLKTYSRANYKPHRFEDRRYSSSLRKRDQSRPYRLTNRNLSRELVLTSAYGRSHKENEFTKQVKTCLGGQQGIEALEARVSEIRGTRSERARVRRKDEVRMVRAFENVFDQAPPSRDCFLANVFLQKIVVNVSGLSSNAKVRLIEEQISHRRLRELEKVDKAVFLVRSQGHMSQVEEKSRVGRGLNKGIFRRTDLSDGAKLMGLREVAKAIDEK